MTTSTKTKRGAKPDATQQAVDVIQEAAQQQRALQAGYHAVCVAAARGDELSADAYAIVAALEKTRDEFASDVGRVQAVARQKAVAGTTADRKSARQSVDAATQKHNDESPNILAQIASLQAELGSLDGGVNTARADVARRETALAWLRQPTNLPPAEQHIYHSQRGALNARLRPGIDRLESRLKAIDAVTAMRWETPTDPQHQTAVNHARNHAPAVVTESAKGPRIDDDRWHAYRNELENERVELVQQLRPLKQQYGRELETVEKMLVYWLE